MDRLLRVCEFERAGSVALRAAMFLAAVEALEKYPFCNRDMTTRVQDAFVEAYGVSAQEEATCSTPSR